MVGQIEQASARARLTGTVYLLYFVTAILAQILLTRGFTAVGQSVNLLADALYIAVTLLLFRMFLPVSRAISLIAALLSLAGCAVTIPAQFHLVGLQFSPLVFFGPFCILLGYLILRCIFLPHVFGILLILAGLAWGIYALAELPRTILLSIQGLGILAEALLMLWLLVKGIPTEQWWAQRAMIK